jgi:hypothetical protein
MLDRVSHGGKLPWPSFLLSHQWVVVIVPGNQGSVVQFESLWLMCVMCRRLCTTCAPLNIQLYHG